MLGQFPLAIALRIGQILEVGIHLANRRERWIEYRDDRSARRDAWVQRQGALDRLEVEVIGGPADGIQGSLQFRGDIGLSSSGALQYFVLLVR